MSNVFSNAYQKFYHHKLKSPNNSLMGIWVLIFYTQKLLSSLLTLCKSFVWLCEEMRETWPEGKVYNGQIEADHMKIRKFASQLWLAVNNWVVEVKRWNSQEGKMVENVRSWRSFVWFRRLVKKLCCTKKNVIEICWVLKWHMKTQFLLLCVRNNFV